MRIRHQQSSLRVAFILARSVPGNRYLVRVRGGVIYRGDSVIHTSRTTVGAKIDFDRSATNGTDTLEQINVVEPFGRFYPCGRGQVCGWIVGRKNVLRFAGT